MHSLKPCSRSPQPPHIFGLAPEKDNVTKKTFGCQVSAESIFFDKLLRGPHLLTIKLTCQPEYVLQCFFLFIHLFKIAQADYIISHCETFCG